MIHKFRGRLSSFASIVVMAAMATTWAAPCFADRQYDVSVNYDGHGDLVSLDLPRTGETLSYDYATGGRQVSSLVVTAGGQAGVSQTTFDLGAGVESVVYSDGASATYAFDDQGRLVRQVLAIDGTDAYEAADYRFNEWGFVESVERGGALLDGQGGEPTRFEFTYDDQGQIATFTIVNGGQSASSSYLFDDAGNLTARTGLAWPGLGIDPLANASYDSVTNRRSDPHWQYDSSGRLTQDDSYSYEYNDFGFLALIRDRASGDVVAHYLYDPNGRRIRSVEYDPGVAGSSRVIFYVRDLAGNVVQEEHLDGDGELLLRRTYSLLNGRAVAAAEDWGTVIEHDYLYADRLGSTALRWDDEGAVVAQEYSPFGQRMNRQPAADHIGPYGFTGHENDHTGVVYMQSRFFDPLSSRFLQPDSARDMDLSRPVSMNLYAYARNNPLNMIDPDGDAVLPALAAVGVFFATGAAVDVGLNMVINWLNGDPLWKGTGRAVIEGAIIGIAFLGIGKGFSWAYKGYKISKTARRLHALKPGSNLLELRAALKRGKEFEKRFGIKKKINDPFSPGGLDNCSQCVIATEYTLRGTPTEALKHGPRLNQVQLEEILEAPFMKAPQGVIEMILASQKEGTRAVIQMSHQYFGSGSHVINAVVDKGGKIWFYDAQTGFAWHSLDAFEEAGYRHFYLLYPAKYF